MAATLQQGRRATSNMAIPIGGDTVVYSKPPVLETRGDVLESIAVRRRQTNTVRHYACRLCFEIQLFNLKWRKTGGQQ